MAKMADIDFVSNVNKEFFEKIENKKKDKPKANYSKQAKLLKKVAHGNRKARKVFAQALVENVTYSVPPQMMFGQFFEQGTFPPDRKNWYYTIEEDILDVDDPAEVYMIYRNGNAPRAELVAEEQYVKLHPYQITSEEYSMDKFALELGMIEQPQKLERKASENIAWKIEDDCENILGEGLYDNVDNITGINISSRVSNYPKTNKLDLSEYDGVTLNTFKDIAKYAHRLGKQIEAIYAPVSAELDMWDWLDVPEQYEGQEGNPPTELIPQQLRERIVTEGVPGQLFGRNFNLQSINTLNDDETEGDVYMWVKFTGGCGHIRYLADNNFEDVYTHEDAEKIYYNLKRTLMLFQTPRDRINYARVKIKDEAQ